MGRRSFNRSDLYPGTYSRTAEIVELARVAARYHGLYASHMQG